MQNIPVLSSDAINKMALQGITGYMLSLLFIPIPSVHSVSFFFFVGFPFSSCFIFLLFLAFICMSLSTLWTVFLFFCSGQSYLILLLYLCVFFVFFLLCQKYICSTVFSITIRIIRKSYGVLCSVSK